MLHKANFYVMMLDSESTAAFKDILIIQGRFC